MIAIFTIVKNEHLYLEEWLNYHINLGIDKIYVFDDPFSRSHKEICDKFSNNAVSKSLLELYSQSRQSQILHKSLVQTSLQETQITYMYTILNYIKNNEDIDWAFYIDVDEFITLNCNCSIDKILSNYSDYEILVLSWKNFGANGHLTKPSSSVIDSYTRECVLSADRNRMTPNASSKLCFNMHKWNRSIVTSHHIPKSAIWCKTNFSTNPFEVVYDSMYIKHYITKSFDEFCNKIYVRGQFCNSKRIYDFFVFNPDFSIQSNSVQEILNKYSDMYLSGKLQFSIV